MTKRKRRDSGLELPASPGWMTTYGDMTTLILTFFVLLFSFSRIDVTRFQDVIISVQGALGILEGGSTLSPEALPGGAGDEATLEWQAEQRRLEELLGKVEDYVEKNGLEKKVNVSLDERGLVIRFLDTALFDLGQADLKPEARPILNHVAQLLTSVPNLIRVEGHTDNLPIHTYRFPSNWELSTARATTVVRYFVENYGIAPEHLSAAGYGEWRPVAPNDTSEHRAQNRRVDIVVLRTSVAKEEPQGPAGAKGGGEE
ncbi:MAG: chemotaxis protein MotB [Bacillota bacterium]|jgi:chemotaxis protein MotB|nr:chemotaxis protein MotB [Bacillota bacterium]